MNVWRDILKSKANDSMLYEGVIAEDASSVNDQVLVTVLAFDEELTWGPAPFMPRVDASGDPALPQAGDPCIIALAVTDDPGEPSVWILGYTDG